MKRTAQILALLVVLVTVLTVSAFASDFDHCADALKDLGLFQGTSKGYELDRAPTRTEAGVMLVRLLGKEEEAKAIETYTAPFTDVQDWAKPYVQYLYDNGLTNGKSETLFGYSDLCTAQQYATFLLRALGYSDAEGGDFTYAKALDFAREKGVVDMANCDEKNFLRDDVVAMSYTALATAPKSGEADLLTKLVKEGAIADAKGYDEKFEAYRQYMATDQEAAGTTKSAMDMALSSDMKLAGVPFMTTTMTMHVVADTNPAAMDQSKMLITGTTESQVDPVLAEDLGAVTAELEGKQAFVYAYTDGYYYADIAGQKYKMPLSFEDVQAQLGTTAVTSVNPICLLKDITAAKSGADTIYTMTYAEGALSSLMNTAVDMAASSTTAAVGEITSSDMVIRATVRNHATTALEATMSMTMYVEGQSITQEVAMKITNIRWGDSVTVKLPEDLDTYTEIIGGADEATSMAVTEA